MVQTGLAQAQAYNAWSILKPASGWNVKALVLIPRPGPATQSPNGIWGCLGLGFPNWTWMGSCRRGDQYGTSSNILMQV